MGLGRVGVWIVTGTVALVGLSACKIDSKRLENDIEEELEGKGVKIKRVKCPKRKIQAGDEFTCEGKTKDGDEFEVEVEQSDNPGDMKWELVGTIVGQEAVEDMIEGEVPKDTEVDCDGAIRIMTKGDKFKCDVTVDGDEGELVVKVKSDEGKVEWKITPN